MCCIVLKIRGKMKQVRYNKKKGKLLIKDKKFNYYMKYGGGSYVNRKCVGR